MILIAKFKEISGLFILRKLAQNLKRTSSKVKTHPYASDPEDCLIFNYEFTAQVEKHLVTRTVWELQFTDEGSALTHCRYILEGLRCLSPS